MAVICQLGPLQAAQLAALNRELIEDEGHGNKMSLPQLAERMTAWLESGYHCYGALSASERALSASETALSASETALSGGETALSESETALSESERALSGGERAISGKRIIAYCLYRNDGDYYYIRHLVTARPCRKRGLASELLIYLRRTVLASKPIRLEVLAGNDAAMSFYAKRGFAVYSHTLVANPLHET